MVGFTHLWAQSLQIWRQNDDAEDLEREVCGHRSIHFPRPLAERLAFASAHLEGTGMAGRQLDGPKHKVRTVV